RGANGVVLITTKKQRSGETKYTLTIKSGLGQIAKTQKLLNTEQYLAMREEAFNNDGVTESPPYAYDVNGIWDKNRYTDWPKKLLRRTSYFQEYQMAISGGNRTTSFLINGSYRNESPISLEDDCYKRANGLAKINHKVVDDKLNLSLSMAYTHEDNDLP